jgi:hypothetical protein
MTPMLMNEAYQRSVVAPHVTLRRRHVSCWSIGAEPGISPVTGPLRGARRARVATDERFSMAIADKLAERLADRTPKTISPGLHAAIDYAIVGSWFLSSFRWWNKNRRAAVASMMVGMAELANTLMTDYPGGAVKKISFPLHGRIALGQAAITASMPGTMGFQKTPEAWMFRLHAGIASAVVAFTDFSGRGEREQRALISEATR